MLRANPETDWSTVDIDKLRDRMVEMDLLTRKAEVSRIPQPGGVRLEIRGGQRAWSANDAIIPTHAPFLACETCWSVASDLMEDVVALIVGGNAEQVQVLGIFGLMTIGAHHQEHHLIIAKGSSLHH